MLTYMVLMPLVGSIIIVVIPITNQRAKVLGILFSIITFWGSIWLYSQYDSGVVGYQLHNVEGYDLFNMGFAIDGISMPFIVLTGFLTPIVIVSSWHNVNKNIKGFMASQLLTEAFLIIVWMVSDMVSFYVAFEAVLIPLFITVGVWGSSSTRIRSAFLLFIYTLSGSLLILISLVSIYLISGSGSFNIIININIGDQAWVWLGIFIAIAVKTPLVPFHIWLPRAHADAPLAASMVLAGTVLKIATYGYLRLCLGIMPIISNYYAPLVQGVATVSIIYSSIATLRQWDMKALIAYSSVGHIAVVTLGVFSNSIIGVVGGIILGIAHGLVSPGLFLITGGVLYDRYHTRIITYYRGLALTMPIIAILFFILTLANIGVPLTLNWIGEFLCLIPIINQNFIISGFALLSVVLSASYSIYLYVRICFGSFSPHLQPSTITSHNTLKGSNRTSSNNSSYMGHMIQGDVNRREFWALIYLIVPVFVFGTYTVPITNSISLTVSTLVV